MSGSSGTHDMLHCKYNKRKEEEKGEEGGRFGFYKLVWQRKEGVDSKGARREEK